jgi:quinohemoprotein ethanol dehydrogenase
MRRFLVFVLSAGLLAAATVALASASDSTKKQPKVSPAAESVATFLPTGEIPAGTDWVWPRGDLAATQFSTLTQITPANVSKLQVAWRASYDADNLVGSLGLEGAPIFISGKGKNLPKDDGTLFMSAANGMLAINPADGSILWKYIGAPPKAGVVASAGPSSRTQEYFKGSIYVGQQDGSLVALNAKTGAVEWTADTSGEGTFPGKSFTAAPPTAIFDDGGDGLVFYGGGSGGSTPIRGHMDAFNAKTGKLVWRFWNTPDPTQVPFIQTWGNPAEASWGGANNWGTFTIDQQRGMLYYGTGNSAPYTGRAPGADLWVASIMALNAKTGKLAWYYQTVKHDEWDSDLPSAPTLFNAKINGKMTPALVVATKSGYIFELNRVNGHPIFPIPQVKIADPFGTAALNNLTGITQPIPTGGAGNVVPHNLSQSQIEALYPQFGSPPKAPNGTPIVGEPNFTPTTNTQYNSFTTDSLGIFSFWPHSYDPITKEYYTCARMAQDMLENRSPTDYHLLEIAGEPTTGTAGYVTALNMTTNKIDWQVEWPASVGACRSGVLSTAGGVVFAASWGDATRGSPALIPLGAPPYGGWIYAYDATTGKQLWSFQGPDYIHAPPMTYMYHGKQYIAWYLMGPSATNPRHSNDVLGKVDQLTVFSL